MVSAYSKTHMFTFVSLTLAQFVEIGEVAGRHRTATRDRFIVILHFGHGVHTGRRGKVFR